MCTTYTVLILIVIAIVIYFIYQYKIVKEGFETYKRNPYDYYETGASPMNFYEFITYRKPYMYPQQFYKSYPLPHLSYYEDSVTLH